MTRTTTALIALSLVIGCQNSDTDATQDIDTVQISGNFWDSVLGTGADNVEVCLESHPEMACAYTDSSGDYTLEIPATEQSTLSVASEDYAPHLYAIDPLLEDLNDVSAGISRRSLQDILQANIGAASDATEGNVHVRVEDVEGVTVTMEAAYDVVHYWADSDTEEGAVLTETSTIGTMHFAVVEAGDHLLTVSHPTLTCRPDAMTWGEAEGETVVPVRDGYTTVLWFVCD